jgi:glycine oxidase
LSSADIRVIGAGIFGLAVAYSCARRGARVQVVEKRAIGAGSSGGVVGALAPHTPERWNEKKQFQFDSLIMAENYWRGVEEITGLSSGYARLGRLQPLGDARAVELARAREGEARTLWQGQAEWRVIADPGLWRLESRTGQFVHDTLSARLHPARACMALAAAVEALHGEVTIGATEDSDVPTVWATGREGLADLSQELGRPVGNGVKGQAALLGLDMRDAPQLFIDGIHIVPHADGTTAIGSTSEREFESGSATDELLDGLLARAIAVCPALEGSPVVARWAGVRPRAPSRAPSIGRSPGRAGHYIANGGFKIGFGIAPKVGEVLADLVLEGRDTIPSGFRVEAV